MVKVHAIIASSLILAGVTVAAEPLARPEHVQRLVDAAGGSGAVTVERIQQDVELASDVRGDVCVLRVPWTSLVPGEEDRISDRAQRSAAELPAGQRRQAVQQITTHTMQVWWVPLANHPAPGMQVRRELKPLVFADDTPREIIHLGNDEQFAWYAAVGVMQWPELQRRLDLTGGDDVIGMALARLAGLRPDVPTACRCYTAIADYGRERAVASINGLIFDGSIHRSAIIRAMHTVGDDEVTEWLIGVADSPDAKVAAAARWALLKTPRQGAADLYVKWLTDGAGKADVTAELAACMAVDARDAAGGVRDVLAKPNSLDEYLLAFRFHRQLVGAPIDKDMEHAANVIMTADDHSPGEREQVVDRTARAIVVLTRAEDAEAAAALGIELAVCESGGASAVGLYILDELQDQQGKKMVEAIATECRDRKDSRRLSHLAEILRMFNRGEGGGTAQGLGGSFSFQRFSLPMDAGPGKPDPSGRADPNSGKVIGPSKVGPAEEKVPVPSITVPAVDPNKLPGK